MSAPAGTAGPAADGTTEDRLLGGRLRLRQPAAGYRVAIDPVFLAAAVPAGPADAVLDLGSGVGAASLCLAARIPACRVAGIEMQRDLVRLAGDNIVVNALSARVSAMRGDLLDLPPRLAPGTFDHVMANPPFLAPRNVTMPGDAGKAAATIESEADLAAWVRVALAMVRAKGSLTFVHRADRLEALLTLLAGKAGEITLYPLWPGAGKPAKRIIIRARKGIASPTRLLPGMILHEADGRFTAAAEAVLRDAAGLEM